MTKPPSQSNWVAWILSGGLILCFWGLYNGYPFVYPDTGTYAFTGFSGEVPIDRPLTYGLFIKHSSMRESLFWVMYAQGILTSATVFLLLRCFLPAVSPALFIGIVLGLTACTNCSLYVSYIMPDLFTPVFFACTGLLLLARLTILQRTGIALLGWLALVMHNSHLLEGVVLVFLLGIGSFSTRFRKIIPLQRTLAVAAIVVAGWLGVMSVHYVYSGKFVTQQAAHVFTLARLHEMGLLKPYLDRVCAEGKNYPICACKDSLPDDFLWSANSPAQKDGGWMAHREEYQAIIGGILTTPKFFKDYLIHAANGTLNQFFYFRAEDAGKWGVNTPPYGVVLLHYPQELCNYKSSHQNHRNYYLDFSGMNTRQQYLFFGFLLLLVLVMTNDWWKTQAPVVLRRFLIFNAVVLVINAFVCSTFSTTVSRYQGRLVWLGILAGFMTLYAVRGALLEKWVSLFNQKPLPINRSAPRNKVH